MKRSILVNGLAVSALLLGIQQMAVADDCTNAWYQSSASQSCGSKSGTGFDLTIKDLGNGQCQIKAWCSTHAATNSYPVTSTVNLTDVPKLSNCQGELAVGTCR